MKLLSSDLARRARYAASLVLACAATVAAADTVVRRDGIRLEGTVVSVDASSVVIATGSGTTTLPRGEVASVAFGGPKPLKVEIKNVRSDDAVDVSVDGDEVIRSASTGGDWVDITPKLKEGNNALQLRVHNLGGVWAYRLILRVNGRGTPLECGTPLVLGQGCKQGRHTGAEIGVIDDLPEIWLHVDRAQGTAEILP